MHTSTTQTILFWIQALKMSLPEIIDLCSDDEDEPTCVNYALPNTFREKDRCKIAIVRQKDLQHVKPEPEENGSLNAANFTPSGLTDDSWSLSNRLCTSSASVECFKPQCRQFWKAGDYEIRQDSKPVSRDGKNHIRVHPKFLHSNATSHKWAFGAIAELLDNAVDEIQNGASFVIVDKMQNARNGSAALLIQDDGGGMDPEALRRCMSFGFSNKQSDSSIGQYGNGFKTSTMRLGADVVVFSRCIHGRALTQSVGLLSYTFLKRTGFDDIVVPIVDYEFLPSGAFGRLLRHSSTHFASNLSMLLKWSPFTTEAELLKQFDDIGHHGTKIIIFNLWFNDEGEMELDFESDASDIMMSGAQNMVEKGVLGNMISKRHIANQLRYSLRVYSSILYLHISHNFQIILRGRVVEPHHLVNDLKYVECIKYQPQSVGITEAECIISVGFLDGSPNVNIHGFNVYHKNRLIMPFWRVVSKTNSNGRGVSGVLEANFIKPTHDKQDFEKSTLYYRLEARLKEMTLEYWKYHCHLVGYPIHKVSSLKPVQSIAPSPHSGLHSGVEQVLTNHGPMHLRQVVTASHAPTCAAGAEFTNGIRTYVQTGFLEKRRHEGHVTATKSSKKQALDGETAVGPGSNHRTQLGAGLGLQRKQEIMIMTEKNKNLHAECLEYEKLEKELLLKVQKLKSEIEEVHQLHDKLFTEYGSLGEIKLEKH
uniref:MORC family CW-type zinc finger protein 4 n=1 Tax=Anthurium amnicola TaxID=1678845 RepID=A0A1D1Z8J6_9ARAE